MQAVSMHVCAYAHEYYISHAYLYWRTSLFLENEPVQDGRENGNEAHVHCYLGEFLSKFLPSH